MKADHWRADENDSGKLKILQGHPSAHKELDALIISVRSTGSRFCVLPRFSSTGSRFITLVIKKYAEIVA